MFIDAHLHVNFRNFSTKDIIAYLDKNKIDSCWVLTWEETNPVIPSFYTFLSVEDVFEAYEKYPSRIVPMYAPDPNDHNSVKKLMAWHKRGIRGCGELKISLRWDSDVLDPLLSCVSNLGLPLLFHMQKSANYILPTSKTFSDRLVAKLSTTSSLFGLPRKTIETMEIFNRSLRTKKKNMTRFFPGYLTDFASLETRLREYPKLNFIGHGPLFWAGISSEMGSDMYPRTPIKEEGITCRLLSKYENLFADISGTSGYNALTRDPSFARQLLSKYNNKILYGTDNYSLGLKDFLESLKLSCRTYKLIYGENAYRLISQVKTPG